MVNDINALNDAVIASNPQQGANSFIDRLLASIPTKYDAQAKQILQSQVAAGAFRVPQGPNEAMLAFGIRGELIKSLWLQDMASALAQNQPIPERPGGIGAIDGPDGKQIDTTEFYVNKVKEQLQIQGIFNQQPIVQPQQSQPQQFQPQQFDAPPLAQAPIAPVVPEDRRAASFQQGNTFGLKFLKTGVNKPNKKERLIGLKR